MEKKLGNVLIDAGNAAKGAFEKAKEKAIQAVDQNDDGRLDAADVSAVAGAVGSAVKKVLLQ